MITTIYTGCSLTDNKCTALMKSMEQIAISPEADSCNCPVKGCWFSPVYNTTASSITYMLWVGNFLMFYILFMPTWSRKKGQSFKIYSAKHYTNFLTRPSQKPNKTVTKKVSLVVVVQKLKINHGHFKYI